MPNQFLPKAHCIYGFPPHMTIADLPPSGSDHLVFLTKVAIDSTSTYVSTNARGVELICEFSDAAFTCDVSILISVAGVDTVVKTFSGVSLQNSQNLFAGNLEFIDLQGADIKIQTANTVNPNTGWISVFARVTY